MADTTTWLYVLRPSRVEMLIDGPTTEESARIGEHLAYLMAHAEAGRMHLVGRTETNDASTLGLVVFDAPGEVEARALMEADPAVASGVMTAELFPFRIAYERGA